MAPFANAFWFIVPLTAILTPLSLVAYLGFRVYCTAKAEHNDNYDLGLAWFFIAIELITTIPSVLAYMMRICVVRRPGRPVLYAMGDDLPAVDVMITSAGEDHDTILNVLRAACESDYPRDKLRVILLDDGRSLMLKSSVELLKRTYPHVQYTSRAKPEVPDYKAGNLNHGVKFTAGLAETPSPFLAGLDADMIVRPHWLRSMIPHFDKDPRLAMVCPPQHFYNIPTNDHLRQDLDHFYAVTETVHDGLGAADCVGSGYVVRRDAMSSIGGFPTFSISEDTGCSSLLVGKGWRVAYVDEKLQVGEMPDTLIGHIKQRTRWTIGNVQTAVRLNCRLWGPFVKLCTSRQRLAGFVFGAGAVVNCTLLWISFAGLPLALLSGYPFVVFMTAWELRWLLRLVSIWILIDWANKATLSMFVGYRGGMRWEQAEQWLVPYYTMAFVRGFLLPKNLGGTRPGFVPTGSLHNLLIERYTYSSVPADNSRHAEKARGKGKDTTEKEDSSSGNSNSGSENEKMSDEIVASVNEGKSTSETTTLNEHFPSTTTSSTDKLSEKPRATTDEPYTSTPVTSECNNDHQPTSSETTTTTTTTKLTIRPSPLHRRLRTMLISQNLFIHVLFLAATLAGVILNLLRCLDTSTYIGSAYQHAPTESASDAASLGDGLDKLSPTTSRQRCIFLLTRIGWPPAFWLLHSASCCLPLMYMGFPPVAPSTEAVSLGDVSFSSSSSSSSLDAGSNKRKDANPDQQDQQSVLVYDPKTGVRYPRDWETVGPKRGWGKGVGGGTLAIGRVSDHLTSIVAAYAVVCLVGSWYV